MKLRSFGMTLLAFTTAGPLSAPLSASDAISVGVKAGVPTTEIVRTAGEIVGLPYKANVSRFTIGPVLNVRFPKGLGLEIGAMYKRFQQHAGQRVVTSTPSQPLEWVYLPHSLSGRSWEFPILGQVRFGQGPFRPYMETGVSFNRLSNIFVVSCPVPSLRCPPTTSYAPGGTSESRAGFVVGGGAELKLRSVRLSPGIRFTRYGETTAWLPSVNSVDVLLGLTF